jgi:hypothetical protein
MTITRIFPTFENVGIDDEFSRFRPPPAATVYRPKRSLTSPWPWIVPIVNFS